MLGQAHERNQMEGCWRSRRSRLPQCTTCQPDHLHAILQVVWITVIVGLLAITLSTSNQDSLQNGLVECVGGVFLKNAPVWITRVLVVILTVPCLVVSLQVGLGTLRFCSTLACTWPLLW